MNDPIYRLCPICDNQTPLTEPMMREHFKSKHPKIENAEEFLNIEFHAEERIGREVYPSW